MHGKLVHRNLGMDARSGVGVTIPSAAAQRRQDERNQCAHWGTRSSHVTRQLALSPFSATGASAQGSLGVTVEEKVEPHGRPQMRKPKGKPVHRRLDKARAGLAA